MTEQGFVNYISQFGDFQKRSMFGGIGIFQSDAMFALVAGDKLFIRGGKELDQKFIQSNCEKYRHVKKQTTATVNYYDVSSLYNDNATLLADLINQSIDFSVSQRKAQKSPSNRRLRDLPNMQLTLERMVKKSGIEDVDTFFDLGAAEVFKHVKQIYGNDVDVKLLWKFAGAIDGVYWKLIPAAKKQQLLESAR